MTGDSSDLTADPGKALGQYVAELESAYRPWYARASVFNKIMLILGQGTAIVAGAATAFIAGLIDQADLNNYRWLLVLLPLIGAFATSLMAQTRVSDILSLRESGRQEIETLIATARASYASLSASAEGVSKLHKDLIDQVAHLEARQSASILSMLPRKS